MTYTEAYNYLIGLNNVSRIHYTEHHKHCDWYLKRMQFFLNLLDNPEKKIPHYIHVTGTSGKGSVCLMLDSIVRASGKKVGTLTSPHPSMILERWEVNGRAMSKKEFVKLIEFMKPKIQKCLETTPYDLPSFSELMTAFGLYYFAKHKVEWAVIEVACGGRYDATNIIPKKDVAVITNVGLDHTDLLGETKEKIAYEKSGIIKRGCKVFTMERDPKVLRVIQRECRKTRTKLSRITYHVSRIKPTGIQKNDTCYLLYDETDSSSGTHFIYHDTSYHLPTLGPHQIKNAILCIDIAASLKISNITIKKGLAKLILPIRMEVVSKNPLIILDGAHNPDKMKTTVETIKTLKHKNIKPNNNLTIQQFNNLHLVVGFAANKNISAMVRQLAKLKPKTIACTRFTSNIFRKAASPADLTKMFKPFLPDTKIKMFLDPFEALTWSRKQTRRDDAMLSTGSIFLSGGLRTLFGSN